MIKYLGSFRDFIFDVERGVKLKLDVKSGNIIEDVVEESQEQIIEDMKKRALKTLNNFNKNTQKTISKIDKNINNFLIEHPEIFYDLALMVVVAGMVSTMTIAISDYYFKTTIPYFRYNLRRDIKSTYGSDISEEQLNDIEALYKQGYFSGHNISPMNYFITHY